MSITNPLPGYDEWKLQSPYDGEDEDEDEWVLACGFEGCCMPGYHFRSECHDAQMIEAQEEEAKGDVGNGGER
jgi:hypothetical protein